MTQERGHHLTENDVRIISDAHLGASLAVYSIKPEHIRFYYRFGFFTGIIGIVLLLLVFMSAGFGPWHDTFIKSQGSLLAYASYRPVSSLLFGCWICFMFSLLYLCILVPQLRYKHLIICDEGLMQAAMSLRRKRVQIVYWKDILKGLNGSSSYMIIYAHDGKTRCIDIWPSYEGFDDIKRTLQQNIMAQES